MENDEQKTSNLIINQGFSSFSVFKFEYKEQNLDNNNEYQKWKEKMLIEYGNNAKQFKCYKDNIIFYSTYNYCIYDPYYKCKCPICKNYICYFCSCNSRDKYADCCIKNSILNCIFDFGPKSINDSFDYKNLYCLIPFLSILMIIIFIFKILYTTIITEKSKNNNNNNKGNEELRDYTEGDKFHIRILLIFLTGFLLCIPFVIFYNSFIILLIIISIPFDFIPLKYYLNIINY